MKKYPRGKFFITSQELLELILGFFFPFVDFRKEKFKASFRRLYSSENVAVCPSFRIGLFLTIQALELQKGDEVIMGAITIPDTLNAIRLNGLRPKIVDLSSDTHSLDISLIQNALSSQTKVILVTHLSGCVTNLDEIRTFCDQNELILIEDFSQAFGASAKSGVMAGLVGDVGIASMSSGKTVSSLIGGVVVGRDTEIFRKIEKNINKKTVPANFLYRLMLLGQLIDNVKIKFFTSQFVFNYLTYYLLVFTKKYKPDLYVHLENKRTLPRLLKFDLFFQDVPKLRESFPQYFFCLPTKAQLVLAEKMLSRLQVGNEKRKLLFKNFLRENSEQGNIFSIPSGFKEVSTNVYYHMPASTRIPLKEIQQELLRNGLDVSVYGLTDCSSVESFKEFSAPCPAVKEILNHTFFIPIFENHEFKDVQHISHKLERGFDKASATTAY